MTPALIYVIALAASYLIGSIPFGFLAVHIKEGKDIRGVGSGNIGATNVRRILGRKWSYFVLFLDMLKGFLPVCVTGLLLTGRPECHAAQVFAGIGAFCGHNWTIFLRFKGGKGVATGTGIFLCLAPAAVGVCLAVFALLRFTTRTISAGSLAASAVLPLMVWLRGKPPVFVGFAGVVFVLIWLRHLKNIKRLLTGTENKV